MSPHHKLSTYDTIKLSLAFCILWFLANYTTNASLAYTTVGSSTILASMSGIYILFFCCYLVVYKLKPISFFLGLFTLGIGALFKVEKLNLLKIFAVFIR